MVLAEILGGIAILVAFGIIETKVAHPMFRLQLFRIRAFTAGNVASFLASMSRGGLMFMLVIWLQGIWLPLHGYSFEQTPLWAGIYMIPLTIGLLLSAPLSGLLADRYGARPFATGGLVIAALTFVLLITLPVNFPYAAFAVVIFFNSVGMGMFVAPNQTGIMNSLPANQRGSGAGMAGTFNSSAQVLSIGIFFTLMILGSGGQPARRAVPRAHRAGRSRRGGHQGLAPPAGRQPLRRLPGLQPGAGAARPGAGPSAPRHRLLRDEPAVLPPPDRVTLPQGAYRGLRLRRRHVPARRGRLPAAGWQVPLPGRPGDGRGDRRREPQSTSRPKRPLPRPSPCWWTDMAVSTSSRRPEEAPPVEAGEAGIRISDAATRAGVSARTLRYYEELGLLTPSLYTPGGERRYTPDDVAHLERILELREVLGMNLDEIKEFLSLETRLDQLRATYRATKGGTTQKARAEQKATLQEALVLNESLAEQIRSKLARMDTFRSKLTHDAQRCRELLAELD